MPHSRVALQESPAKSFRCVSRVFHASGLACLNNMLVSDARLSIAVAF